MILRGFPGYRVMVQPGRTDMRKGANSLAWLVQAKMELDPYDKVMFVFCGTERKTIKILAWDTNGFWVLSKRCGKGTFAWPETEGAARSMTREDLSRILAGENVFRRFAGP